MNSAGPAEDPAQDPAGDGLDLIPFRGVRYHPDRVRSLAAVTSPPYDVVVRPDGLHHLESADPYNIVRLILPQARTSGTRSRQAADTLREWLTEGVLTTDPEPALYVYEQHTGDLLQRGLIGALRLSEASRGVVLPHEDVMPGIVAERADLMRTTSANLEPLLLTYRGDGGGALRDILGTSGGPAAIDPVPTDRTGIDREGAQAPPGAGRRGAAAPSGGPPVRDAAAVIADAIRHPPLLATTTEDGVHHRLWSVTDPGEIAAVRADLGRHQALIADGHHRWATYLTLRAEHDAPGPWDHGLVLLVDTARYPLRVRAIHRLLHRLPVPEALAAVAGRFRVRRVDGPLDGAMDVLAKARGGGNAFLLAGDGAFHLLDRPSPGLLDDLLPTGGPAAWRTLDATVLHAVLLDRIWQVPDTPEHIAYIHDAASTVAKAEREGGTAVLMHPVREDVVRDLARQGVMMPRKSTSFGPKPATGLVLRVLDG
ncbi:hypothetical protein GCM10018793_16770 [Streptomyces sulfonofaciens]|uniref:DUF1015 domain-containing protein n=1 Tax=Streptomyces sulfonofaciens TaxID=68272 RepID=A0A919KW88_9ACTN|nr:DUF1015 domain-containing protein [Streptomyces sulfonofaciens]GHH74862.1 hypothetical protein GCM10018793_16770 [Streptomyces sulfonofaciens]